MNSTEGERKAAFARSLAALNSQFAAWVAQQSSAAPQELWIDGTEDYLQYAKQLLADYKEVLDGSGKADGAKAAAAAAASGGFGFGAGSGGAAASKPPLAPGGLFGSAGAGGSGAASAPASIFGGLAPAGGSGGAFGLGGGGGFGGSAPGSAANSGGSGLFTVPSTGTLGSSFNTGAAAGADEEEAEEGEEQQNAEPSVRRSPGAVRWRCLREWRVASAGFNCRPSMRGKASLGNSLPACSSELRHYSSNLIPLPAAHAPCSHPNSQTAGAAGGGGYRDAGQAARQADVHDC